MTIQMETKERMENKGSKVASSKDVVFSRLDDFIESENKPNAIDSRLPDVDAPDVDAPDVDAPDVDDKKGRFIAIWIKMRSVWDTIFRKFGKIGGGCLVSMFVVGVLGLLMILFSRSCGGQDVPPHVPTATPIVIENRPEDIAGVVDRFIKLCDKGNHGNAIGLVIHTERSTVLEYSNGNPCTEMDPVTNRLGNLSESESVVSGSLNEPSNIAEPLLWQWESDSVRIQHTFIMTRSAIDNLLYIQRYDETSWEEMTYELITRTVKSSQPNTVYRNDPLKPDTMAYVETMGTIGSVNEVYQREYINGSLASEVLSRTVPIEDSMDTVVVYGGMSSAQAFRDVESVANSYLQHLSDGRWSDAIAMSDPTSLTGTEAKVAETIGLEVVSFDLSSINQFTFHSTELDPTGFATRRNGDLEYDPYNKPVYVQATFPVVIEYNLYGKLLRFNENLFLFSHPDEGWVVYSWLPIDGTNPSQGAFVEGDESPLFVLNGAAIFKHGIYADVSTTDQTGYRDTIAVRKLYDREITPMSQLRDDGNGNRTIFWYRDWLRIALRERQESGRTVSLWYKFGLSNDGIEFTFPLIE